MTLHLSLCLLAFSLLSVSAEVTVERSPWGTSSSGEEVELFRIRDTKTGLQAEVASYGALLSTLGYLDDQDRVNSIVVMDDHSLAGAENGLWGHIVGRYANRIDTGGFVIDGQRHDLTTVHPRTGVHIHGGKTGLHRQVWAATPLPAGVQLTITSPHGHEGYPGDLTVMVSYTLEHGTDLRITYEATTTKPTHLNLTNHAYFHLHPESKQSIRDHRLRLSSDHYLAIDKRKVPTGDLISVANTSFDFRHETRIGDLIERAGGYDHCFIVRGEPGILRHAATLTQAQADLQLNVLTTQPGVQLYTANHRKAPTFPLICFETQHYPDTPNQSTFPTTLLRPDETFQEETVFRLTTTPSRTP